MRTLDRAILVGEPYAQEGLQLRAVERDEAERIKRVSALHEILVADRAADRQERARKRRIDSGHPGVTPIHKHEDPVTGRRVRRYGDQALTEGGVNKRLNYGPKAAVEKESTAEGTEPGGSREEE